MHLASCLLRCHLPHHSPRHPRHPEFQIRYFQVTTGANGTKAALVGRRSFTRSYDVDAAKEIPKDEAMARRGDPEAWGRLSRRPLTRVETAVMIRTAFVMHSRAV